MLLLPVLSHRPDHLVGDRAGESVLLGEGEGRHPQGQLDADDDGEADGEGQQGAVVLLYGAVEAWNWRGKLLRSLSH